MSDHQNYVPDVILGAGGVASPWWYVWLHQINEIAATVALFGGAILVMVRLYFAFLSWREYTKSGELPNADLE